MLKGDNRELKIWRALSNDGLFVSSRKLKKMVLFERLINWSPIYGDENVKEDLLDLQEIMLDAFRLDNPDTERQMNLLISHLNMTDEEIEELRKQATEWRDDGVDA